MIFNVSTLHAPLSTYVESIFHFKNFIPDHSIERVVPTGHVFVIFELDGFVRNTFNNATLKPDREFTKVWVSGLHKNYISISAHENSEMFVIQFKPFGAFPFIHESLATLSEKILPGEFVFGKEILELREQILPLSTSEEKFETAQNWLLSRYIEQNPPPETLINALNALSANPASNYQQVVGSYPSTQKHLIDQFKKYVGVTPKYFQRIQRFNEILHKIHQKEKITWAQIAYQSGFSDQSHFIKEFKHFSGFNPEEFISKDFHNDEQNFFPLDREG